MLIGLHKIFSKTYHFPFLAIKNRPWKVGHTTNKEIMNRAILRLGLSDYNIWFPVQYFFIVYLFIDDLQVEVSIRRDYLFKTNILTGLNGSNNMKWKSDI